MKDRHKEISDNEIRVIAPAPGEDGMDEAVQYVQPVPPVRTQAAVDDGVPAKAYTQVRDTVAGGIELHVLTPVNATPSLEIGFGALSDTTVVLAAQAADTRRDNGKIVCACVVKGELLSKGVAKAGFCSIIGGEITIGVADATPMFEQALAGDGDFFRQYPLVVGGQVVENKPKNESQRRALAEIDGKACIVSSARRVTLRDFSQALVEIGVRNAIYSDWVPWLWRHRDYATAILLSGYADNLAPRTRATYGYVSTYKEYKLQYCEDRTASMSEIRSSDEYYNPQDYGSLSFQLMGSLTSRQLMAAYGKMQSHTPLYTFLRRKARTDRDYVYELAGTLSLREEDYAGAVRYLSMVSSQYLRTTNIYKQGWLKGDPFQAYGASWTSVVPVSCGGDDQSEETAKLRFARQMLALQRQMRHGRSADERGMARLAYAVGRYNSFEDCWFMTQYWRGEGVLLFSPASEYYYGDYEAGDGKPYGFLYSYGKEDSKAAQALYSREVAAALAMLASDEARARAEYYLGNLRTVVRRYGETAMAGHVRARCDRWRQWL